MPTDAVPIDAVPIDAVPIDAVPIDAVPTDAAPMLSGTVADVLARCSPGEDGAGDPMQ